MKTTTTDTNGRKSSEHQLRQETGDQLTFLLASLRNPKRAYEILVRYLWAAREILEDPTGPGNPSEAEETSLPPTEPAREETTLCA